MLQKAVLRGQFVCVVCVAEGCVCDGGIVKRKQSLRLA